MSAQVLYITDYQPDMPRVLTERDEALYEARRVLAAPGMYPAHVIRGAVEIAHLRGGEADLLDASEALKYLPMPRPPVIDAVLRRQRMEALASAGAFIGGLVFVAGLVLHVMQWVPV